MNAEQTVDSADEPADDAADKPADRSGVMGADISAMRDPVGNALRLRRQRTDERCGDDAGKQNMRPHAIIPLLGVGCRHVDANQGVCAAFAWQQILSAE